MIEATMQVPPGYAMFIPSAIRAGGLAAGGRGRPVQGPAAGRPGAGRGQCDLIGVVRGQIADPDFAAKARAGHATQIRTCLSCNQECVGRMGLNRWLGCIENPRTGRESVPLPAPRRRGRRVYRGRRWPGGLQAAVTAAERGHRVTLFERSRAPAVRSRRGRVVPTRAEFLDMVRNLAADASARGRDQDRRAR